MATLNQWIEGARPRTLTASVAPVAVGLGAAYAVGPASLGLALLALVVSLCLQIGGNYANDYSDGIRGTDAVRVGPTRLVGAGLAAPESVKIAAYLAFFLAGLFGFALVALTETWLLLLVGAVAMVGAWRYTGGERPYGYRGLGEVSVFVFFGLVATLGTLYTQTKSLSWPGLLGAVGVGALATALLVANNLRDIPTDAASGKRTVAVRLGDKRTRLLWAALAVVAMLMVVACARWHLTALVALLSAGVAWAPAKLIREGATGPALVAALVGTGRFQLAYGLLLGLGLGISRLF
ncbi:MAG: 1,4-dihydroxy-2-naphthoate polyprenyltransferase [Dermatophilaceae bacterium]